MYAPASTFTDVLHVWWPSNSIRMSRVPGITSLTVTGVTPTRTSSTKTVAPRGRDTSSSMAGLLWATGRAVCAGEGGACAREGAGSERRDGSGSAARDEAGCCGGRAGADSEARDCAGAVGREGADSELCGTAASDVAVRFGGFCGISTTGDSATGVGGCVAGACVAGGCGAGGWAARGTPAACTGGAGAMRWPVRKPLTKPASRPITSMPAAMPRDDEEFEEAVESC